MRNMFDYYNGQGQNQGVQQPASAPEGMSQAQITGLLLASGVPFGRAVLQSASVQQQQQQAQQEAYRNQLAQQQFLQQQQVQQQAADYINNFGASPEATQSPVQPANSNATLANANATPAAPVNSVSPETKRQAQILAANGDIKGAIKLLNEKPDGSELDKQLAKKDATTIQANEGRAEKFLGFRKSLDSFESDLKDVPDSLAGPVVNYFKLNNTLSSKAQSATAAANTVTLLSRELLNMPAGNFSDADRDFLKAASVGLDRSKDANVMIIKRLKGLLNQGIRYVKTVEKAAKEKGNLRNVATDFYESEYGTDDNTQPDTVSANMQARQAGNRSIQDLSDNELQAIINGK